VEAAVAYSFCCFPAVAVRNINKKKGTHNPTSNKNAWEESFCCRVAIAHHRYDPLRRLMHHKNYEWEAKERTEHAVAVFVSANLHCS
jgi:hypothetical protein